MDRRVVKDARPWRWKCPHCQRGNMRLPSGVRHIRLHHNACFSCKAESLMLRAMMEGKGFIFHGDLPGFGLPAKA